MISLCIETSHRFLVLALISDNSIIARYQEPCFKRQSESILPCLQALCEEVKVTPDDIGEVVITRGPGSYTGVRIAMSIAKVFCSTKNIPLYTLSTLQLYASNSEKAAVLLDARSKRGYFGLYSKGELIGREIVDSLEVIEEIISKNPDAMIIGDGDLIGLNEFYLDLPQAFLNLKSKWQRVENIHTLVPEYLKSQDEYLVK